MVERLSRIAPILITRKLVWKNVVLFDFSGLGWAEIKVQYSRQKSNYLPTAKMGGCRPHKTKGPCWFLAQIWCYILY
jgi:hypothetical protein